MEKAQIGKSMSFVPFNELFPKIAEQETRVITVLEDASGNLPPDGYAFLELFCNEVGCDCRRVMFTVVSTTNHTPLATIAYGWEKKKFYVKWARETDPVHIKELIGPVLNMGSPETEHSDEILDTFKKILLKDKNYMERVKRHYWMFREKIEGWEAGRG